MQTPKLRIGLVGAGENTRLKHIPGFLALPSVQVVSVANRTRASGERVAREFGIEKVASDWRAVVEDPEVDAVCIGTWPYLHADVSIAALSGGKHVLTEARMARTAAEAEAMLEASRRRPDLVAQIVPAPMSLAFDAVVAGVLKDGRLGELWEVAVVHTSGQFRDGTLPLPWRLNAEYSGVNMLTLGIHYEIVLRWLGVDAQVLAADGAVFHPQRSDEAGVMQKVTLPESVSVLARLNRQTRLWMHFSSVEANGRHEIRINGSKGCLRFDLATQELWLTENGLAPRKLEPDSSPRGQWRVEADFVDSIRSGTPVKLTDFATGVRYMRFTEDVWAQVTKGGP